MLKQALRNLRAHMLPIFSIVALGAYTWKGILSQSFMGEAYLYFRYGFFFPGMTFKNFLIDNDKGARIYFDITKQFFHDSIFLYQVLMFSISLIIFALFYLIAFAFTKSKIAAFFSVIFFSVNYASLFEFLAWGRYDVFVERMINALLLFPSFMFFALYVQKKKMLFYIISVILYVISIYTAHFSIFYLPTLFFYFAFFVFLKAKSWKKKIATLVLFSPYVFSSALFLGLDKFYGFSHIGQDTFPVTLEVLPQLWHYGMRQITYLTIPNSLIEFYDSFRTLQRDDLIATLYIPIVLLYGGATAFIAFVAKDKKYTFLALTLLASLVMCSFLNMYMRWYNILHIPASSRYLFVLSIPGALFWGLFFYTVYRYVPRNIGKILVGIVIIGWMYTNATLLSTRMIYDYPKHVAVRNILSYIKEKSLAFSDDAIIIIPDVVGSHGANFMQIYYGKKDTYFTPLFQVKQYPLERTFDPKKDVLLKYDYQNEKVVDITAQYNEVFDQLNTCGQTCYLKL